MSYLRFKSEDILEILSFSKENIPFGAIDVLGPG